MATAFNANMINVSHNQVRNVGKVVAMPKKAPELENDAEKLRKIMLNAYRIGDTEYAERAKRRVWELNKLGDSELDQGFGEVIAKYEALLTERNDRTTRATRTWQKVRNKGVKQAIIEWVTSKHEHQGFVELVNAGFKDHTIEALVVNMPHEFEAYVIKAARKRLQAIN